jgi:hypothetical protein
MSDLFKSLLREFAQKLVGIVAVWLIAHGLPVPAAVTDWTVLAIVTVGLVLWTALVRWFETRYGNTAFARILRGLGRLLMLGIGTKPTYVQPPARVIAQEPGGEARTVVR